MEIESDHQFAMPNNWGEYYAALKITGQSVDNYKVSIEASDTLSSKNDSIKSYYHHDSFVVKFDKKKNIFYNGYKKIDEVFNFPVLDKKRRIRGAYPVIKLGTNEYYCINDTWYAKYSSVPNDDMVGYCTHN